jgi:phosphate-selective porin OprO/OprP
MRRKYYNLVAVFIVYFIFLIPGDNVNADSSSFDKLNSEYKTFYEKVEKGVKDPVTGYHISWKEGFHLVSPKENLKIKIGGKLIVDGGNIDADEELQRAFPNLDGNDINFRDFSVDIFGNIYDSVDFRFEIDFANAKDIKDNWIRFSKIPYLKHTKIGHMKEPFSLEEQTGINSITFMERALPVQAFSPGRNFGLRYDHPVSDSPINWSAGIFLNTGSFSNLGETSNQISFQADGFDKIGTELAVVSGPLSFQGECFYTLTDAFSKGDPDFWGAYAYLSYFITGEHRKYRRSEGIFSFGEQYYRFNPLKGNWGAWELGLRYSYVDLNDAEIKGGKERNFTAGLNWYHKRNVRVMLNYIGANVKDRALSSIENGRADIFQLRFQIVY